jgi:hypothetical protein
MVRIFPFVTVETERIGTSEVKGVFSRVSAWIWRVDGRTAFWARVENRLG